MPNPEQAKAALEGIIAKLTTLIKMAEDADESLLVFMLDQAKAEAENQLRHFRN